ncbi:MAG TPA: peptidoglycan recognition family protein [Xanthobacteraceae bacterium]|nr:peptidoglycan recognition family protein [Xanthobacteraceae bacterium]
MRPRRVACLATLAVLAAGPPIGHLKLIDSAWAEPARPAVRSSPAVREQMTLPRPRPAAARSQEAEAGEDADAVELPETFRELAKRSGEPQIPGLSIVYLHPLGLPADANNWRNIIVHQTEGPAGSAKSMALAQAQNPTKRGVMLWVETDGTVYWATAETAITTHGDGANRNDNKYVDNSKTYRSVIKTNSIGVEFVGNYPDVAKPATREQRQAWLVLVRFLQERYDIPTENIYAHNWIDFKDRRYCEGCELTTLARKLAYQPGKRASGQ